MALLSVADALARVLEGAAPLPAEQIALTQAEGRVLAEDLAARRTQPPDDVSAMDVQSHPESFCRFQSNAELVVQLGQQLTALKFETVTSAIEVNRINVVLVKLDSLGEDVPSAS